MIDFGRFKADLREHGNFHCVDSITEKNMNYSKYI